MPASGRNAGCVAAFLFDAARRRASDLCSKATYIRGKKNVHNGGLTDMVIRRQKSDVNVVDLVKNLENVILGSRFSCLFDRSFGDAENYDYGYDDDTWDNDYAIDE